MFWELVHNREDTVINEDLLCQGRDKYGTTASNASKLEFSTYSGAVDMRFDDSVRMKVEDVYE